MNETFTSPGIKFHGRVLEERNAEIEATDLTEDEAKFALWIGKTNKWYLERRGENETFKPEKEGLNIINHEK